MFAPAPSVATMTNPASGEGDGAGNGDGAASAPGCPGAPGGRPGVGGASVGGGPTSAGRTGCPPGPTGAPSRGRSGAGRLQAPTSTTHTMSSRARRAITAGREWHDSIQAPLGGVTSVTTYGSRMVYAGVTRRGLRAREASPPPPPSARPAKGRTPMARDRAACDPPLPVAERPGPAWPHRFLRVWWPANLGPAAGESPTGRLVGERLPGRRARCISARAGRARLRGGPEHRHRGALQRRPDGAASRSWRPSWCGSRST